MTCVECGKEATYWLCSNECARRHLDTGRRRNCAVCSFDRKTQRLGTLSTNRICRQCKAAPENAGWFRGRNEDPEPDALVETRLAERLRLLVEQDRPLPEMTPRYMRIVQMVLERKRVSYVFVDKRGRKRGIRYRWQAYTVRRIAELEGCSKREVEEVIDSIEN